MKYLGDVVEVKKLVTAIVIGFPRFVKRVSVGKVLRFFKVKNVVVVHHGNNAVPFEIPESFKPLQ